MTRPSRGEQRKARDARPLVGPGAAKANASRPRSPEARNLPSTSNCYAEPSEAAGPATAHVETFANFLFTEMLNQWDTENS